MRLVFLIVIIFLIEFAQGQQYLDIYINTSYVPEGYISLPYSEDFSTESFGWDSVSTQDYETYYKDGRYHIKVLRDNFLAWAWRGDLSNFNLEVEANQEGGSLLNQYGVILRKDIDNFYLFAINGQSEFRFCKSIDGNKIDIIPLTKSDAIRSGYTTNTIKVECNGNNFNLYANGEKLGDLADSTFASGSIGFAAGGMNTKGCDISFDNLKIW